MTFDYDAHIKKLAIKRFDENYTRILDSGKVIPFTPEFDNGTGYHDSMVKLVKLEQGEEATMIDGSGRKCILIGTLFGTVILFHRYTDREDVWGCNFPRKLNMYGLYTGTTGIMEDAERYLNQILGFFKNDNIGQRLNKLLNDTDVYSYVAGKAPIND
jgi:hypothetical protein